MCFIGQAISFPYVKLFAWKPTFKKVNLYHRKKDHNTISFHTMLVSFVCMVSVLSLMRCLGRVAKSTEDVKTHFE